MKSSNQFLLWTWISLGGMLVSSLAEHSILDTIYCLLLSLVFYAISLYEHNLEAEKQ